MSAAQNRFKQAKPCRPQPCETQAFLVPSIPARAGMEPRPAAPLGLRPAAPILLEQDWTGRRAAASGSGTSSAVREATNVGASVP